MNIDYRDYLTVPWIAYYVKKRKWAFISDYIRYVWFENHDGIWFDTDYFLIKEIPEIFLDSDFSIGCDSSKNVNQCIMRIRQNNPFIQRMRYIYENMDDLKKEYDFKDKTSPKVFHYAMNKTDDFRIKPEEILDLNGIRFLVNLGAILYHL